MPKKLNVCGYLFIVASEYLLLLFIYLFLNIGSLELRGRHTRLVHSPIFRL